MLHLLQMGTFKVLTTLLPYVQNSWRLSLLELSPYCGPGSSGVTSSSDSSSLYTSTVQSGSSRLPSLLMQHSHSTIAFKPPIPLPSLRIFSLCTLTTTSCSWLSLNTSCFLFPPPESLGALQWNAGGLRARSTELQFFLSSHPVDLICIQESNLNPSSSFRILGFSALRSDRTHSRSGILSPDATQASSGVIIFIRQGKSFSELSTSPLSSLDPYSDYVRVNSSLNN